MTVLIIIEVVAIDIQPVAVVVVAQSRKAM
jgi:hypothetical protein